MKGKTVLFGRFVTGVLALWLLMIVARLVYGRLRTEEPDNELVIRTIPEWRKLTSGRSPSLGVATAEVVIVEFSDYECPFCADVEPRLQRLVAEHSGHVAVYRYDLPNKDIHPFAQLAALAANCAALQGVNEAYQAELFINRKELAAPTIVNIAKRTGVKDIDAFEKCISDKRPIDKIERDIDVSRTLSIFRTPTLLVNGNLAAGALSSEDLDRLYVRARDSNGWRF